MFSYDRTVRICASSLLLLYCILLPGFACAEKPTLMADILFKEESAKIPRVDLDTLELLVCRVIGSEHELEMVLVIGHADPAEKDAERLGWNRVEEVKRMFIAMGGDPAKIYVESKGNRHPISQLREKSAANRRVEIEVLFNGRKPTGASRHACGDLRWKRQLQALESEKALIIARSLVKEGGMKTITPFLEAVTTKRLDLLRALLASDSGLVLGIEDRVALFMAVARTGDPVWIKVLMDFGIKPAEFKSHNELLVAAACAYGTSQSNQEVVRLLLLWGVKPASIARDRTYLPLECAASRNDMKVVDLLLEAGASPNEPTGLVATVGGKRDMVYRLLRAGADPLARSVYQTWEGRTLFHTFRMENAVDVEWLLGFGLDINAADKNGRTPLNEAVGYASDEVLDTMLNSGASIRKSREENLLSDAHKNPTAMIWLIRHGVQLANIGDFLTWLIRGGERNFPVLKELVERGIDINQKNSRGETLLAIAITHYQPTVVQYLLKLGADQQQVGNGLSALQLAEGLGAVVPQTPSSGTSRRSVPLVSPEGLKAKKEIIDLLGGSKQ